MIETAQLVQELKGNRTQKKGFSKAGAAGFDIGNKILKDVAPELVAGGEEARACPAKAATPECCVAKVIGIEVVGAKADASAADARANAVASPLGAEATASACGAQAGAKAHLIEDVIEANARAVAAEAAAGADVGLKHLGAHAGAHATVARAEAGIEHTPLKVHAEGPGANAETGVSWDYTGATVGAHAGEARAGPFAVRAGVKFGAGIRNGIPEVDLGPTTVPCVVM